MPTSERPSRIRLNDNVRSHITLWVTLILLAGVAAVVHVRISLFGDMQGNIFRQALIDAANAWLLGTLPVLLAGGLAIAMAPRRTRLLLAVCFVFGSTVVEVVGYATWSALSTSSVTWWREAIYAVSAVFLAAAWLTARAWGPPGLLASPIAGIASWFVIPHFTAVLYHRSEMRWGYGTWGQFIGLVAGFALEVLVLSLPSVVLIVLRWARMVHLARASRLTAGIAPGSVDS